MARKKIENEELVKELNIDKDALIKEIKNSLDEEIKKKVDYESRNKLDKMEKRIYRQRTWSLIRRDIIILLLLGLAVYEGKILYDNNLLFGKLKESINPVVEEKKEDNKEEEKNEESKEENVKDSKWYIDNYSYLINNINTNLSGEDKYYLYNNLNVSDMKNSVKLNMAYQLLDVESSDGVIRVSDDDLKEKYSMLFTDEYKGENFTDNCINFIYNKDNKGYIAVDIPCEDDNKAIIRKIVDIYEQNENIVIELKAGIFDKENNNISIINGDTFEYNPENINKLKTYKFIFKDNYLNQVISE